MSETRDGGAFSGALARFRALQAGEVGDPRVNPDCRSALLEHGRATDRAVLFLHGITSSPVQFTELGRLFHARGYNVLIPRLPRHGYLDRLSHDQAKITRDEYRGFADAMVDIAAGLGRHLTVGGLSVSGVLAAWCAQTRADVDLAVVISPSFAPYGVPMGAVPLLSRVATQLPNAFIWWDLRKRAELGPACGYPRFSTHALAESFLLGQQVYARAGRQPPRATSILAITNARDITVNNEATRAVVRRWRAHGSTTVREHEFGRELGPLHDFIAPYQTNARTDYVYPILLDLIDGSRA